MPPPFSGLKSKPSNQEEANNNHSEGFPGTTHRNVHMRSAVSTAEKIIVIAFARL
jgi:hypothetical protein